MIQPFILSQVGEKQNELIFAPNAIDELRISKIIYDFFDKFKNKKSFFRCVKIKNQIISAYYWKSCIPEPKSGRLGLYVIIGFLIPERECQFDYFWKYSSAFFRIFEDCFEVNLKSEISDRFLLQIQTQDDLEKKMDLFLEKYKFSICSYLNLKRKNIFFRYNFRFKNKQSTNAIIYMMNFRKNFYDDWAAFTYESFLLASMRQKIDISTLTGYTPSSLRILQNGKKIYNTHIAKIMISKNPICRYLIIYIE